jgi:hypothetical protein
MYLHKDGKQCLFGENKSKSFMWIFESMGLSFPNKSKITGNISYNNDASLHKTLKRQN